MAANRSATPQLRRFSTEPIRAYGLSLLAGGAVVRNPRRPLRHDVAAAGGAGPAGAAIDGFSAARGMPAQEAVTFVDQAGERRVVESGDLEERIHAAVEERLALDDVAGAGHRRVRGALQLPRESV